MGDRKSTWISYSTISAIHKIIPIVNAEFTGSVDAFFNWRKVSSSQYEGSVNATPYFHVRLQLLGCTKTGYTGIADISGATATIYYQRPAL